MGRPVMLSNGRLAVGLNEFGLVHDFYYPYIGLENLTTARSLNHLIGVWINGKFSWVDDGSWQTSVDFDDDALISDIRLRHPKLAIELHLTDFVDVQHNAFCRRISVHNLAPRSRQVRLFLHQVFLISRSGRADTALFVPEENYILDYKGRCCLLAYGEQSGKPFDQYAVGIFGIEGKEGTFRDAEDGELSGNPVEHGGVDSVMRFSCHLKPQAHTTVDYWVVAADSQQAAEKVHHTIKSEGLTQRLAAAKAQWQTWLAPARSGLAVVADEYRTLAQKSLLIIKSHIDERGGIIASCDSSIFNYGRDYYSYVWPRDSAYVLWPLIRLGYQDEPKRFFEFCRDILMEDGYLMHKYQPDRAIGSTWHPLVHGRHAELAIQEDETAIVLYMLGQYYDQFQDDDFVRNLYETLIKPAANFLASYIDEQTHLPHASYDLWEEKFLTTTYSSAVVYQALLVAAQFAELFEYPDDAVGWQTVADSILEHVDTLFDTKQQIYRKGFLFEDGKLQHDNVLDVSSLYGVMMFGLYTDSKPLHQTAQAIESTLLDRSPSKGCPRYLHDGYFASRPPYVGNPWLVTTLWMAQYYIRVGKLDRSKQLLAWVQEHCLPSGVMPEQVDPTDGKPVSVAPLIWSQAEYINTVLDLAERQKK